MSKWWQSGSGRLSALSDALRRTRAARKVDQTVVKASNAGKDILARMERRRRRRKRMLEGGGGSRLAAFRPVLPAEDHAALAAELRSLHKQWEEDRGKRTTDGEQR